MLAVDREPDPAGPGEPFAADLATREGNRAAVAAAVEQFGGLDALVANAGFQHVSPFDAFDEDRWDALLAVLLTSPFLLARYAWPHLQASGEGRILVVASVHGIVASPFKAGYVAAKHGAVGLVKSLALEGAEHGIRATALCPGFVRTPLVQAQVTALAAHRGHHRGGGAPRRAARAAGAQGADRAGGGRERRRLPARPGRARVHRRRPS